MTTPTCLGPGHPRIKIMHGVMNLTHMTAAEVLMIGALANGSGNEGK